MTKAKMIIVPEPQTCGKCPCFAEYCKLANRECDAKSVPVWCPLKPMPVALQHMDETMESGIYWAIEGWNACLKKIEGESENQQ